MQFAVHREEAEEAEEAKDDDTDDNNDGEEVVEDVIVIRWEIAILCTVLLSDSAMMRCEKDEGI